MKKILLNISCIGLSLTTAYGTVTVTGARIEEYKTFDGTDLTGAGVLGLLVVDTGGNGFGAITAGTTIDTDTFLADGDDLIVNIVGSIGADGFGDAYISGVGTGSLSIDLAGAADAGDQFAVYWFPTLTTSDTSFTSGDTYGIATVQLAGGADGSWILPADGVSTPTPDTVFSAGLANLSVVPEPTSLALLGLGALGLITRRRRD